MQLAEQTARRSAGIRSRRRSSERRRPFPPCRAAGRTTCRTRSGPARPCPGDGCSRSCRRSSRRRTRDCCGPSRRSAGAPRSPRFIGVTTTSRAPALVGLGVDREHDRLVGQVLQARLEGHVRREGLMVHREDVLAFLDRRLGLLQRRARRDRPRRRGRSGRPGRRSPAGRPRRRGGRWIPGRIRARSGRRPRRRCGSSRARRSSP